MLFRLAGPMKDKCFVLLCFFFFAPSYEFTTNELFVPKKQHLIWLMEVVREFICEIWVTPRSPEGPRLGEALCNQNHVSTVYSGICPLVGP